MARARELGAAVLGTTSPNPPVGAVILDASGTPVGEGATAAPGGPHAEVAALAQAGERARGGTAVVTLEPCAHTGRTGPCADALLAAGIARVVVAVPEPTELADGGAERLRAAGVDVQLGVEQAEAEAGALAAWLTATREHRPFVVWKVAATLDGRVGAADGTSRWITGEEARAAVHRLRATCDAVVVGSGTALTDDPRLTVRDADVPHPEPAGSLLRLLKTLIRFASGSCSSIRPTRSRRRKLGWAMPSTEQKPARRAPELSPQRRLLTTCS